MSSSYDYQISYVSQESDQNIFIVSFLINDYETTQFLFLFVNIVFSQVKSLIFVDSSPQNDLVISWLMFILLQSFKGGFAPNSLI